MSLELPFDSIEAYFGLLDRLEREGLVPGMDIPSWAALLPRDTLRTLPAFTKEQLPFSVPKDHPSVVKSFFTAEDPAMKVVSEVPNNIGPNDSYRLVPQNESFERVIECLKLPPSLSKSCHDIKTPSRIPALIELQTPQLREILPRKAILNSIGFPDAAYATREVVANVTPTGYQAAPHIDLMEVVVVVGTTTKLWVFFKTPAPKVGDAIGPTKIIEDYNIESMQTVISAWSPGPFYILLQKPGDLVIVPSGWWHFVETLCGASIPMHNPKVGTQQTLDIPSAQEELNITISFFTRMVDYICELLENDTAPWRILTSVTNALKPFNKMVLEVADRLENSVFPYTLTKAACQKIRVWIDRFSRAMKTAIETAGEVLNQKGFCATFRGCKWLRSASDEKKQTWIEHCLGSTRHFPFGGLSAALNDVIVARTARKKEKDRRVAEARKERQQQRQAFRTSMVPVRRNRRIGSSKREVGTDDDY
ncbi:hypothetical protein TWF173_003138 [Orbilia oligospora]|nr:hypothetical protein TWF173_003138 [Orbilia oligospora]